MLFSDAVCISFLICFSFIAVIHSLPESSPLKSMSTGKGGNYTVYLSFYIQNTIFLQPRHTIHKVAKGIQESHTLLRSVPIPSGNVINILDCGNTEK
jgi:hypothetical protein